MLVELAAVFEEQMKDLANGIDDPPDVLVAFGDLIVLEGSEADEHALQDVNDLDLQLRVRDLLINGKENI